MNSPGISSKTRLLINRKGFHADVRSLGGESFTVGANQETALIALMLERQREAYRSTLREVASRLGQKSVNACARYEQGKSVPAVKKLNQLMRAIDPSFEPVIRVA